MRIAFLISVIGKVKRGGEATSIGLVEFLQEHAEVNVLAGGDFPVANCTNLGFPELPVFQSLYAKLPAFLQKRFFYRLHLDPLQTKNRRFARRAIPLVEEMKPDLVVLRSLGPNGMKAFRAFRERTGIPVVTIEGGWNFGEREVARYHPNLHIPVNLDVEAFLNDQLPEVSIKCLPNATRIRDYDPNGEKAEVDLPRPLILGCGYLGDVKRFDLTIKAVQKLGKGSLLLLGYGDQKEHLEQLGKSLLGDRFRIGRVPFEEMADYYRSADVVTVPSSGESFGMVYIESMACNTPVVATRDRNREMIVEKGGVLVDPTNIEEYTKALAYCLEHPFGNEPREQAELFDWARVGPRYLRAFEEVAAGKHGKDRYPIYRPRYFRKRNG